MRPLRGPVVARGPQVGHPWFSSLIVTPRDQRSTSKDPIVRYTTPACVSQKEKYRDHTPRLQQDTSCCLKTTE